MCPKGNTVVQCKSGVFSQGVEKINLVQIRLSERLSSADL